jgi:hypothetical protein
MQVAIDLAGQRILVLEDDYFLAIDAALGAGPSYESHSVLGCLQRVLRGGH